VNRRATPLCLIVLLALLVAACAAPAAPPAPAPAQPPAATAAQAQPSGRSTQTLTVFAAASLTESFTELGKQFEAAHPGVKVVFNFAGSQQLRAQLEQGAGADVFASANTKEMNTAIGSGTIVSGTQKNFARNRLIAIYPKDNPANVASPADLARPGLKLDIADKAVPAGQYTLDMLAKMSKDPAYGKDFAAKVLKNVVSYENDVKVVVSKVSLGEADAGVVYSTDVTAAVAPKVGTLKIPDQFNQLATYPIAPVARAAQPDLARQFTDLVLSDGGQQLLAKYGFITAKAGQ
jgi:molybdate transport system substrate-binding protein